MPAPVAERRGGRGLHTQRGHTSQSTRSKREKLPVYLSALEVEACIAWAPHNLAGVALSLMWRLGLRVSEAADLKYSDIVTAPDDPGAAKVVDGKGGKDRLIPIHGDLAQRLAIFREVTGRSTGHVVADHRHKKYTRRSISQWAKDAYAQAVLKTADQVTTQVRPGLKVSAHTFRHSAARHWLAHGVPLNQVSAWLGHSDLDTTYRYLKILPDTLGSMDKVP